MTHDTILSRGIIGSFALTLMLGIHPTSVRADGVQPLPRPTTTSIGDEARWLERLPPATQPLPRSIEVAQSDTDSLQEAQQRLESRVESGAFESTPGTVEMAETPAQEPTEFAGPGEESEQPVSAPQSPVAPEPPVAPAPPVTPIPPEPSEPVSVPIDVPDAAPDSASDDPPPAPRTIEEAPPSMPETPPADSMVPNPVPSRDEASEDAVPAPLETAPETTGASVEERIVDVPEPAVPAASGERWQVQLLAGRSLSRVERDRDDLQRFHGDTFAGLTLTISQASPKGLHRLRALDWPSRTEADAWCRRLRAATGLQCLVVRDEPPSPAR